VVSFSVVPRVVEWLVTRGTTENDTTEEVASLSGNVTEWTDTDTVPGVTYYYRLHGMSDSGLGGHCSDAISATATGPSPPQTEVPFFTSPLAIALATAGLVGAGFVLRRR